MEISKNCHPRYFKVAYDLKIASLKNSFRFLEVTLRRWSYGRGKKDSFA